MLVETGFNWDTWKVEWILSDRGSSSRTAAGLMTDSTLKGTMKRGESFLEDKLSGMSLVFNQTL